MSNLLATLNELILDVESAKYKLGWVLRELDQLKIQFEDTDIDPPDEHNMGINLNDDLDPNKQELGELEGYLRAGFPLVGSDEA
jgi:hypothetical protein